MLLSVFASEGPWFYVMMYEWRNDKWFCRCDFMELSDNLKLTKTKTRANGVWFSLKKPNWVIIWQFVCSTSSDSETSWVTQTVSCSVEVSTLFKHLSLITIWSCVCGWVSALNTTAVYFPSLNSNCHTQKHRFTLWLSFVFSSRQWLQAECCGRYMLPEECREGWWVPLRQGLALDPIIAALCERPLRQPCGLDPVLRLGWRRLHLPAGNLALVHGQLRGRVPVCVKADDSLPGQTAPGVCPHLAQRRQLLWLVQVDQKVWRSLQPRSRAESGRREARRLAVAQPQLLLPVVGLTTGVKSRYLRWRIKAGTGCFHNHGRLLLIFDELTRSGCRGEV